MPLAAVIDTALGGGVPGPAKSLWIEGVDVLKEQGTPGNRYGVRLDSIEHVENGPPGVSTLKFELRDPQKAITLARGQRVVYHNHVTDRPYFYGWLKTWSIRPFGLGRVFSVSCTGAEIALDWFVVPSLTIVAGTRTAIAVQMCVAAALGPGIPLRAFSAASFTAGFDGSQAEPVAAFGSSGVGAETLVVDVVIASPVTLREAINNVFAASIGSISGGFDRASTPNYFGVVTVDAYLGVRAYAKGSAPYPSLTVTDTFAGPIVAEHLAHAVDVGESAAGVYVQGGAPAGTGLVPTGDGLVGPIRVLQDSTVTTTPGLATRATAFLTDKAGTLERGSLDLLDNAITTDVHPGSSLVLTDDETGGSGTYKISSITRRFTGLRESWTVTYGKLPPSLARSVRRLTRGVLS